MNRRAFLSTLAAGLAGLTLDPERLLWRPGAKTIFLPAGFISPGGYIRIGDEFMRIVGMDIGADSAQLWTVYRGLTTSVITNSGQKMAPRHRLETP